jgi:hypothetical protein
MAAARSLDVILGAGGGGLRRAAAPACVIGLHTVAVTVLSRHEVTGSRKRVPQTTLAITAAVGAGAMALARPAHRIAAAALVAQYARQFGGSQVRAVRDPGAATVRKAVGAGILGLLPLQGSLLAGMGAPFVALPIAAAGPLARRLARKVSPT